jgi:hypothetical protein
LSARTRLKRWRDEAAVVAVEAVVAEVGGAAVEVVEVDLVGEAEAEAAVAEAGEARTGKRWSDWRRTRRACNCRSPFKTRSKERMKIKKYNSTVRRFNLI